MAASSDRVVHAALAGNALVAATKIAAAWKRHYGPVWQTVEAAKAKFDPKNVLTPGHGMFPG